MAKAHASLGDFLKAFTLDTNCLFVVDESRPEAADVRALASAHQAGQADVAVVAISASENRQGGGSIEGPLSVGKRTKRGA
jgi:hypothetical protein